MTVLRSTSRAPLLYRLLAGFGPLRPLQIEKALGVSKNGVRDLVAALVKAGLAERAAYEHHTIIRALPRARRATLAAEGESRSVETSRSEEHTSELQSLMRISYAVFCLKKKKTRNKNNHKTQNI